MLSRRSQIDSFASYITTFEKLTTRTPAGPFKPNGHEGSYPIAIAATIVASMASLVPAYSIVGVNGETERRIRSA